jgi:uncharacterized protein (DUF302 family)
MHGFTIKLKPGFNQAVYLVKLTLKIEGLGVLSDVDVQATLKAKLGSRMRPYRILGACNPSFLAHQVLTANPDIGLLLPCNVIVRQEDDDSITVDFIDPEAVMSLVDKSGETQIAAEARAMLERVRVRLIQNR